MKNLSPEEAAEIKLRYCAIMLPAENYKTVSEVTAHLPAAGVDGQGLIYVPYARPDDAIWADTPTLKLFIDTMLGEGKSATDKAAATGLYHAVQAAGNLATLQDVIAKCDEWIAERQPAVPGPMRAAGYTSFKEFYEKAGVRDEVNAELAEQLKHAGADIYSLLGVCIAHLLRISIRGIRGKALRALRQGE